MSNPFYAEQIVTPGGIGSAGGVTGIKVGANASITGEVILTGVGGTQVSLSGQNILISGGGSSSSSGMSSGANIPNSSIFFLNNGIISGDPNLSWDTINDTLIIKSGNTTPLVYPTNPLNIVGSGNGYLQVVIQNRSTGISAQSDFVVTADVGNDTSYFADFGINNSGFADTGYALYKPLDAYLYNRGGDMWVGAAVSGKAVKIHVGMASGDTPAIFNSSGLTLPAGDTVYINGVTMTGSFLTTGAADARYVRTQYVSKNAGWANNDGIPSGSVYSTAVWRCNAPSTLTGIMVYRLGGSGCTVQAYKNINTAHLSASLSSTATGSWQTSGTIISGSYVAGDSLTLSILTISGLPTSVSIQADFTQP